ncbi:HAD family hydrolase [Thalassococcus sp. S3]|uniref:HAD family hydrolase n=1 Tax=Thalassococcus sp. S3 TaxID=2017482 RepID=UPI001024445C|nr:HAD family hydrolase [Thalassococcus sp. S3]QBF31169.1 phosphatase [Thalassococcus sp. S3]
MKIEAILFDKDGTLFDFSATWDVWAAEVIRDLAGGQTERERALAGAVYYDLDAGTFLPESRVIAGTNREAAECFARELPERHVDEIEIFLAERAKSAPLVPAVPLGPCLDRLLARDLALGVMTNDTESGAYAHLDAAGIRDRFAFVAGFDSGFGAKPAPDPLLAFCRAVGVTPEAGVMVGDSPHDLIAGRAAGMRTAAVLTGVAGEAELAPLADVVLPDIGHLEGWIAP